MNLFFVGLTFCLFIPPTPIKMEEIINLIQISIWFCKQMFSELILLLLAIFYINVKSLNHNCFIICQHFNVSIILSDITNSIEIACTRIHIEYQTSSKFHGNLSNKWKGKVGSHTKDVSVRMTSINLTNAEKHAKKV